MTTPVSGSVSMMTSTSSSWRTVATRASGCGERRGQAVVTRMVEPSQHGLAIQT